jgi:hypothetical protein
MIVLFSQEDGEDLSKLIAKSIDVTHIHKIVFNIYASADYFIGPSHKFRQLIPLKLGFKRLQTALG